MGRIGVLGDLGRLDEARPLIEQAATARPGDPDVTYLRARLAAEDGEWARVREMLQPLEASNQPGVRLLYARSLVELDLHEQARGILNPMLRELPGSVVVRRLLASAMIGSGDPAGALAVLDPVVRRVEAGPEDLALFASAARAAGRTEELDAALRDIPPPERVAHLLAQADAAMREGKWRTAIDSYEGIRQWTGSSSVVILNNLAYARGQAGQTQQAIELAREAHRLAPRNASVTDTLGWLLWDSGEDREEGLRLLRTAADLAPDNASIAAHLREAQDG
jgi:Flp pilus assembly protein TadD